MDVVRSGRLSSGAVKLVNKDSLLAEDSTANEPPIRLVGKYLPVQCPCVSRLNGETLAHLPNIYNQLFFMSLSGEELLVELHLEERDHVRITDCMSTR